MGPIFSDSEEDFSIPKVQQLIIGEENSIYSVHQSELTDLDQSSGIFQVLHYLEQTEKGRS